MRKVSITLKDDGVEEIALDRGDGGTLGLHDGGTVLIKIGVAR